MTATTREVLPNRRFCECLEFEHEGQKYVAHVGRYSDGRFSEVFLTSTKVGTHVDTAARDASIAFSYAVQHGATPEDIRQSLTRNTDGSASGPLGHALDLLLAEENE